MKVCVSFIALLSKHTHSQTPTHLKAEFDFACPTFLSFSSSPPPCTIANSFPASSSLLRFSIPRPSVAFSCSVPWVSSSSIRSAASEWRENTTFSSDTISTSLSSSLASSDGRIYRITLVRRIRYHDCWIVCWKITHGRPSRMFTASFCTISRWSNLASSRAVPFATARILMRM